MNNAELVALWDSLVDAADAPDPEGVVSAFGRAVAAATLRRVNAAAEADMLAGRPVTGAHHRAIEAALRRLEGNADA